MKRDPGSKTSMTVRQRNGNLKSESRYSMIAPGRMAMGRDVWIENLRFGGVRRSRLAASAKKAKTSGLGRGTSCSRART